MPRDAIQHADNANTDFVYANLLWQNPQRPSTHSVHSHSVHNLFPRLIHGLKLGIGGLITHLPGSEQTATLTGFICAMAIGFSSPLEPLPTPMCDQAAGATRRSQDVVFEFAALLRLRTLIVAVCDGTMLSPKTRLRGRFSSGCIS